LSPEHTREARCRRTFLKKAVAISDLYFSNEK